MSVTYRIPAPGEVGPNHEEFVDALGELALDWDGDDCGVCLHTPLGTLSMCEGTLITLDYSTPGYQGISILCPDNISVSLAVPTRRRV